MRVTSREVLSLALPAAASALLNNAFRIIDQHAADQLGTAAQAAIGSCVFVLIGAYGVHMLVAAGAAPLVARATGAADTARRSALISQALVGAGLIGLGIAVLAHFYSAPVVALLGLRGVTAVYAEDFLRVILIGGIPAALAPTIDAIFIAVGHTRTMMALQLLCAVLNYLGNLWAIREGYGVAGTAWATVFSRTFVSVIGLVILARRYGLGPLALPEAAMMRIGSPIALNTLAYAAVYWALLHRAVSPLGDTVNAALGIGFSALEGISYPIYVGLSQAVSSIVGRRLGAGQPDEARRAGLVALPWALGSGIGAGAVFYVAAPELCGLFTHDPAVLEQAVIYTQILGLTQVFVALEALAEGVLMGAGVTVPVFLWSVPLNVLRVPLGALFGGIWGAAGVWWAINLTSIIKALGKSWSASRIWK